MYYIFFKRQGCLEFTLNCHVIFFDNLPTFYKEILSCFNKLQARYNSDQYAKKILSSTTTKNLNNGKPFFKKEQFNKGSIMNLFHTADNTSSLHFHTKLPHLIATSA